MEVLLTVFGEAFGDAKTYGGARPSRAYLERLLASDAFIALAALKGGEVVGGIAAYDLKKFEHWKTGSAAWRDTCSADTQTGYRPHTRAVARRSLSLRHQVPTTTQQ